MSQKLASITYLITPFLKKALNKKVIENLLFVLS